MINKSKSYILPLFAQYLNIEFIKLIYNTYLFLENDDNKYFILQYIKNDSEEFNKYISELRNSEYVYNIIDNGDYLNVILNVPVEIQQDYDNFIEGNFSEIKNKNLIVNFLQNNYGARHFNTIQRIKQVLYKDKALKAELEYTLDILIPENSELSSIPVKNHETLII